MTIEIDDSGESEIVGGAFIGMYRRETRKMLFWELPVYLFDEYGWAVKMPMFKIVDLIIGGLKKLNQYFN